MQLAGEWGLKLCEYYDGIETDDVCILPGTLSENKKGLKNYSADTTKLSLEYTYTGSAVYEKKVIIPKEWSDKSVTLVMERTKNTRVWINGKEQTSYNTNDSLAIPHIYYLNGIRFGEENTISIEVTNGSYDLFRVKTHMLTDETQTDWNGIIGKIELKATEKIYIKALRIYPDAKNKKANVKVVIKKDIEEAFKGNIKISAWSCNHSGEKDVIPSRTEDVFLDGNTGETVFECSYDMGDNIKLWSEFHPSLYCMKVSLDMENGMKNDCTEMFGMRDFFTDSGQFMINGKITFLRGEANSAVFPLTGYPFMTKSEWEKFFEKAKSMGINFFRFHSWTPPMAAFCAADEMGIYMQPEMYGFGGIPTGFDTLYGKEGERILEYFANNPSFVMMTFGNEMTTGDGKTKEEIKKYRCRLKEIDSTRLFAEGTNNNLSISQLNNEDDFWTTAKVGMDGSKQHIRLSFAWNNASDGGRLEGEQPNSCHNFDKAMEFLDSDIPVMGHETGQYQVYPDFEKEIPKYQSGLFCPANLYYFKAVMKSKGLLEMNKIFSRVTARTSAIAYRADIEAALKTQKFGGYQLLSIQDFPGQNTALVGILDSFMDDKDGGFRSEEYKSFNSPVTVLARIPGYIYSSEDDFFAEAEMINYSEEDLENVVAKWKIKSENNDIIKEGELLGITAKQGGVTTLGSVSEKGIFSDIKKAQKLVFEINALKNINSYSLWVYPVCEAKTAEDVFIADLFTDDVLNILEVGGKVILMPAPNRENLPSSVSVRWTNDFWSSMFHGRVEGAANTMGLYVEQEHKVFDSFPTEWFGDYQWYNLMKCSRAIILDDAPLELKPMAWNIDHMAYSRKLGSMFEAKVGKGKLLVCTMDILNQMEKYPEVRQMYNSIVEYVSSDYFNPTTELTKNYLKTIFKMVTKDEVPMQKKSKASDTEGKLRSPYDIIDPSNTSTGAVKFVSLGGVCETEQLTVRITDRVKVIISDCDFGLKGSSKVIIGGSIINDATELGINIIYKDNGEEQKIPVIFKMGEGEEYTVKSGTTGEYIFYRNTIELGEAIKGVQDLSIEFPSGTLFEFGDVVFVDSVK